MTKRGPIQLPKELLIRELLNMFVIIKMGQNVSLELMVCFDDLAIESEGIGNEWINSV